MDASRVAPLSESLGLPDVFPFQQESAENLLTPESLANGYRISYEQFGITDKGELELTLCNQDEEWAPARVLDYRRAVLQQLRLVYRSHRAKRKAGVLYDEPLTGTSLSSAIAYPQQHTVGEAARQQWVQDLAGSVPLDALAASVPHGFMRGKLFEMLAEQCVALPRAIWFIQVAYLNRTKPESWDGGSRLPTRSTQCTEDVLGYLEQAAAAAVSAGRAASAWVGDPAAEEGGTEDATAGRWQYMLRLAGALQGQGLLHVPSLVGWLLGRAASLGLGAQLQLLPLLHLTLREVAQSPPLLRQVVEACIKQGSPLQAQGSSAAAAAPAVVPAAAVASLAAGKQAVADGQQQQQQQAQMEEEEELRRGFAEVAATLLALAPLSFVPLDQPTLSALGSLLGLLSSDRRSSSSSSGDGDGGSGSRGAAEEGSGGSGSDAATEAVGLLKEVEALQLRLAGTVNPRVLRLQESKAMQLLDSHLAATCDAPAAHAELWKQLLPPAPSHQAAQEAQRELVRLVCIWAVAHPPAQMAAALRPPQQQGAGERWARHGGLQPSRALLALAILRHHVQQQQQQRAAAQPQQGGLGGVDDAEGGQAFEDALFSWLDNVAQRPLSVGGEGLSETATAQLGGGSGSAEASQYLDAPALASSLAMQRVHRWAVLLLDSGLLSPGRYLRSLLASGALPASQRQPGPCPRAGFHLGMLQELHPSLIPQTTAAAAPPPQPQSPSPASAPMLAGHKRKLSDGGEAAGSAAPQSAPAAAEGQQQQQQQGQQQGQQWEAAASYAALRRAVLQEYGGQGGPVGAGGTGVGALSPLSRTASLDASINLDELDGGLGAASSSSASLATATASALQSQQPLGEGSGAALAQLKARLLHLLGAQQGGALPGAADGLTPAAAPQPLGVQQQLWRDATEDIWALSAWQHRHMASWLYAEARQHLRSCLPPPPQPGQTLATAAPTLSPQWLLNVLAALEACGGYKEVADLLCDLLAALLRTVATAAAQGVGAAARGLSAAVWGAQDRFWRHTGLPPSLVFRLASAYIAQLAALARVPRLLRMLTAGLWTLLPTAAQQQKPQPGQLGQPADPRQRQAHAGPGAAGRLPQQPDRQAQQEVLACCHAQLALAGELLSLYGGAPAGAAGPSPSRPAGSGAQAGRGAGTRPAAAEASLANSGVQQWLGEMEKQHGGQHWLLAALRRLAGEAAASRAQPPGQGQPADPRASSGMAAGGRGPAAAQQHPGLPQRAAPLLNATEWLGAALRQSPEHPGSGALLLEASQQLPSGGCFVGAGPGDLLPAAWAAADQLAAWVCLPPDTGAQPSAQGLQEHAVATVFAIFSAHATAGATAAAAQTAEDAGWEPGLEAAGLQECLLRLGELLGRRSELPAGFLAAAVAAAALHAGQLLPSKAGGPQHRVTSPSEVAEQPFKPGSLLVGAAITQGLVPLDACLRAASPSVARVLMADPYSWSGLGSGEAWALAAFQRCLPLRTAAQATLTSLHSTACEDGGSCPMLQPGSEPGQPATLTPPISPAVQEACLSNPRILYSVLARWAAARPNGASLDTSQAPQPYPPLSAALSCLTGCSNGVGAGPGVLDALLASAEPSMVQLCWLVVRGMLDEQAFQMALRRGESARSALASVAQHAVGPDNSQASLSEAEKDFTSRVLAELAVRPEAAATLSALCGEVGRGVGDYLLQQLDWVLQDPDTLLGRRTLALVLARRGGVINTAAFKPPQPATPASPPPSLSPAAAPRAQAASVSPGLEAAPFASHNLLEAGSSSGTRGSAFAVERGFVEACLVCLAASSDARRRSFAQQLVTQLQRLADAVARLALPGSHAAPQPALSPAKAPLSEGVGEAGSPGLPALQSSHSGQMRSSGGGWGRSAASSGGWGAGARSQQRGKPAADAVGSVAGVQVGVWLRLGVLFPLLPLVYSDTSPDPANTLRALLLGAITRLMGSPYIAAIPTDWAPSDPHAAAATAAAEHAGEPLPARLLHMLHALAGSSWASWLQGGRQLRDVAALDGARQLAAAIEGLPAPKRLKLAATAAVPAGQLPLATLPAATLPDVGAQVPPLPGNPQQQREVPAPKAPTRVDPWLLLPSGGSGADSQQYKQGGGAAGGGAPLAPHWLQGAVRVRKRDVLSYCFMSA